MSKYPRRTTLVVATLALAGGAVFAASAAASDDSPEPEVTIGALDTTATARDRLPSWFASSAAAEHMDVSSARYIDSVGNRDYYLLNGADTTTCLIYVAPNQESAGTCAATEDALSKGIYLIGTDTTTATTAVVVPDGYDEASTSKPDRVIADGENLTVLSGAARNSITLTGEGNTSDVTINVGKL